MNGPSISLRVLVAAFAAAAFVACGGDGGESGSSGLASPEDLAGGTIGVVSLASMPSLQLRFVLLETYGMRTSPPGADVVLEEGTADSLPDLLRSGDVESAILPPAVAAHADADDYELVANVSAEMEKITGRPVVNSVVVTYADLSDAKTAALEDANDLLGASVAYLEANQSEVADAVTGTADIDETYASWLSERQRPLFGDSSADVQEGLARIWEAAVELEDIDAAPALESVLLPGRSPSRAEPDGDRVTLSVALQDGPVQRMAVHAIEQGLVTSDRVDLDITFLGRNQLAEAAAARQYDLIEVSPLAVPTAAERDLALIVVSGGIQDIGSTLLFVRR